MNSEVINKTKWAIDNTHSEVQFKVRHLVISTVTGHFKNFEGTFTTEEENMNGADVSFKIDVNSIDTNVADRDRHLKSDDFFSADKYPNIIFDGQLNNDNGDYSLIGNLTIRDITKEVTMDVDFGGIMVDPYGQTKAGFEVLGKVNRKEFGLAWDAVTEAGGIVVSDEIKFIINAQFIQQA